MSYSAALPKPVVDSRSAALSKPRALRSAAFAPIRALVLAGIASIALAASPAAGKTLRFAFQGDLKSLDPYTLNETHPRHWAMSMKGSPSAARSWRIFAGLAERWEIVEPRAGASSCARA